MAALRAGGPLLPEQAPVPAARAADTREKEAMLPARFPWLL